MKYPLNTEDTEIQGKQSDRNFTNCILNLPWKIVSEMNRANININIKDKNDRNKANCTHLNTAILTPLSQPRDAYSETILVVARERPEVATVTAKLYIVITRAKTPIPSDVSFSARYTLYLTITILRTTEVTAISIVLNTKILFISKLMLFYVKK